MVPICFFSGMRGLCDAADAAGASKAHASIVQVIDPNTRLYGIYNADLTTGSDDELSPVVCASQAYILAGSRDLEARTPAR